MKLFQNTWTWYRNLLGKQSSLLGKLIALGAPFLCICCVCFSGVSALLPRSENPQTAALPTETRARSTGIPKSTITPAPLSTRRPTSTPEPILEPTLTPTDESLAIIPTEQANDQVTGTAKANVNIRAQPDANAQKLGQLKAGDQIVLTGKTASSNWLQFEKGWVIATAIDVVGDIESLQTINITNTPLPTQIIQQPTTLSTPIVNVPTVPTSGKFVASSQAKEFYYCVTDSAWKELKSSLIWSNDESTFTNMGLRLHKQC